jgi:IS1 family transposase
MVSMNRLDTASRTQVVRCLIEGMSIRSTVRMTGIAKNTVTKLLVELGAACAEYLDKTLVNLKSERIQCDEIWTFVGAKQKNVTEDNGAFGDAWTWTAIDADSKLVCGWLVGHRDWNTAFHFVNDLQARLANRVQLTSDGLKLYFHAVSYAFQGDVDYAVLKKIYGGPGYQEGQTRYSPATCIGCTKHTKIGNPDPEHISTSYVERQNLTMRMSMRRFTRLTNGFSKKVENHVAALALYFMWYNFGRKHQTLGTTPAVKAGVADHIWSVEEVIGLLEKVEPKATRPAKISN